MKYTRRDLIAAAPATLAMTGLGLARAARAKDAPGATFSVNGATLTRNARPYLAWRYAGETAWRSTSSHELELLSKDGGFAMRARFLECRADIECAANGPTAWTLSAVLKHTGKKPIELARFHLLDGRLEDSRLGLLMMQGLTTQRLVRAGERIVPFARGLTDLWASMKVRWTTLSDPIYGAPDWALSRDIGFLAADWREPCWGAGFTGPGLAFGEIGFRTQGEPHFFIGQVLDNILLEPGETRAMDTAMLWHGDWQAGLKEWIVACARDFGARQRKPPPVGYCSWYQKGQKVTLADMQRATQEFAAWPKSRGGRLIQIDDGYQVMPGDWQPNAKFAGKWRELAQDIANTGSIPGTYLAPLTIHESHPLVQNQPQMLQRLADDTLPISFANWGGNTYYVEPDHPRSKDFMRKFFADAKQEGWQYIKIDFTYGISTARVAYDRKLTSFQTSRNLYKLFREAAGPAMLLNACIGEPGRYAIGLVDAARIGGDIGAKWQIVKDNLINALLFAPTNGVWWQADPDVFYMRRENSALSTEESFVLTGTVGLLGGLFLTSDFPSQWPPEAQALVREFWNDLSPMPPADQRIVVDREGVMRAYRVSYAQGQTIRHRVAIYNWGDSPQTATLPLIEAGIEQTAWRLADKIYGKGMRLIDGALVCESQPPHSLRIADLTT